MPLYRAIIANQLSDATYILAENWSKDYGLYKCVETGQTLVSHHVDMWKVSS